MKSNAKAAMWAAFTIGNILAIIALLNTLTGEYGLEWGTMLIGGMMWAGCNAFVGIVAVVESLDEAAVME